MPTEVWRVGDISITKVVERELFVPLRFFGQLLPTSSRAEIEAMDWLQPDYVSEGMALVGYYSFLVETPHAEVSSTAVGNSKSRTYEKFDMLDTSVYDADQVAAATTRRAFLDRYADTGTVVLGTHFGTPTGVLVHRDRGGFRLTPHC